MGRGMEKVGRKRKGMEKVGRKRRARSESRL